MSYQKDKDKPKHKTPKEKIRRFQLCNEVFEGSKCVLCGGSVTFEIGDPLYLLGFYPGQGMIICYRHLGEDVHYIPPIGFWGF